MENCEDVNQKLKGFGLYIYICVCMYVKTQFGSQAQESKGSWPKEPNTMNL